MTIEKEQSDYSSKPPADGQQQFVERWRENGYNCYSSGHKFCREVCPVMQVTRNENHTPTAFMANIIAMDRGLLDIEDVADDYVHCVQCGACEIRCPNTLFVGDFYQARTETVKVVRAARALMVDKGLDREGWKLWNRLTLELTNEPVLGTTDDGQPQGQAYVRNWADGLNIPIGGETIMFVDCEAAFYRTSNTRGHRPGAAEGRRGVRADERTMVLWRSGRGDGLCGAVPHFCRAQCKRLACIGSEAHHRDRTARLHPFHRGLSGLLRRGLRLRGGPDRGTGRGAHQRGQAGPGQADQQDRHLSRPVSTEQAQEHSRGPPLHPEFDSGSDVHRRRPRHPVVVLLGGGGGLPIEKPDITAEISRTRLARARELGVDMLVSACVWSERPLATAGHDVGIEVADIIELVAESAGIDIGGRRGASELEATR